MVTQHTPHHRLRFNWPYRRISVFFHRQPSYETHGGTKIHGLNPIFHNRLWLHRLNLSVIPLLLAQGGLGATLASVEHRPLTTPWIMGALLLLGIATMIWMIRCYSPWRSLILICGGINFCLFMVIIHDAIVKHTHVPVYWVIHTLHLIHHTLNTAIPLSAYDPAKLALHPELYSWLKSIHVGSAGLILGSLLLLITQAWQLYRQLLNTSINLDQSKTIKFKQEIWQSYLRQHQRLRYGLLLPLIFLQGITGMLIASGYHDGLTHGIGLMTLLAAFALAMMGLIVFFLHHRCEWLLKHPIVDQRSGLIQIKKHNNTAFCVFNGVYSSAC